MAIGDFPNRLATFGVKRYARYLNRYSRHIQLQRLTNLANRQQRLKGIVDEVKRELFPPETEPVSDSTAVASVPLPMAAGVQSFSSTYWQYRCVQGDPLRCDLPHAKTLEGDRLRYCQACQFPAFLPEKAEIRGDRGNYQIDRWIGRRGMGRLYWGVQLGLNRPVVVKEYLLPPDYFNQEEQDQQKQLFQSLAGLNLADGRSQDDRILEPLDAIVDEREERCYLIADERTACPSLNQYLTQGAFSQLEVQLVLNQVLQTLECLHGQKFRLPAGYIQSGFVHGNLSLDSLLVVRNQGESYAFSVPSRALPAIALTDALPPNTRPTDEHLMETTQTEVKTPERELEQLEKDRQATVRQEMLDFFIHICDLNLWEDLFHPPNVTTTPGSVAADLRDLGYVGFYLLAGGVVTEAGQALDPIYEHHWSPTVDPALRWFILRLIGLETPFESAKAARQELLRSLPKTLTMTPEPVAVLEPPEKKKSLRWLWILLGILGVGILSWLLWSLLFKPKYSSASRNTPQLRSLQDVSGIPPGTFTYTATKDGIWSYVLQQPDLIQKGQTLEERLKAAQPKLNLSFKPTDSIEQAIAQVRSGEIAFVVTPLLEPPPPDLEATAIAYDGLAVLVPFSYSKRSRGLPSQLQGNLSLEQLRRLYLGEVGNWQELGGSNLPIKLYAPADSEAVQVFEQRVLSDTRPRRLNLNSRLNPVNQLPEFEMLRQVIKDFESRQVGSVAFSSLSKVIGQCSVYPLALRQDNAPSVQPLILTNGEPISPTTDLCTKKGAYLADESVFQTQRYPLSYAIAVLYLRDNSRPPIGEKFAELLKTQEGQRLLQQTGLVPLQ